MFALGVLCRYFGYAAWLPAEGETGSSERNYCFDRFPGGAHLFAFSTEEASGNKPANSADSKYSEKLVAS